MQTNLQTALSTLSIGQRCQCADKTSTSIAGICKLWHRPSHFDISSFPGLAINRGDTKSNFLNLIWKHRSKLLPEINFFCWKSLQKPFVSAGSQFVCNESTKIIDINLFSIACLFSAQINPKNHLTWVNTRVKQIMWPSRVNRAAPISVCTSRWVKRFCLWQN